MASLIDAIQDIITKLETLQLPNGDGIIGPTYTRIYNQQIKDEIDGKTYDFPKPAIFLEIQSPINWLPAGGYVNLYTADIIWVLHLMHEEYDAGDGTMDQNIDVYRNFRNKVIALFSLYHPTASGPMVLMAETPDFNHTNLAHHILEFKSHFVDSLGSPYDPNSGRYIYTTSPTSLEIDVTKGHHSDFTNQQTVYKQPYIISDNGA